MCGIVGILGYQGDNLDSLITQMRDVFPYRGPDDKGSWVNASSTVALGHRRLSIIDTSSAGHQPMFDVQGELVIVFNGEIYNYLELRQELEKKGYTFHSKTDTEVILASYREWGSECLQRFNGMWAFAIWNEKTQSLFLARDRLGIKPLYYYSHNGVFYFASEVKAILAGLKEKPGIARALIDAYMSFGYIPGEDTLFEGIKRLLPGHSMIVTNGECRILKYWNLHFSNQEDSGFNYYLTHAQELLEDAIQLRLRSDVPLGIFLSGGLDSSSVVGLLARKVPGQLKTFSVAYEFGPEYNETNYAQLVAKRFNTDHHEFFVTPQEFQKFIPNYMWLMDEPVTESAAISLYFISRLAKEYVTVVLSGEGSDEVFAGYDFYRYMILLEKFRGLVGENIAKILYQKSCFFLSNTSKIRKYLLLSTSPLEKRYKGISTYEDSNKELLYSDDFLRFMRTQSSGTVKAMSAALFEHTKHNDALSKMLYFDIKTWLLDDLLIKADRMSMAASLELRVPFLDHRLVEFAATMPSKYKLNRSVNKYILKEMVKNILPQEIVHRKKMGFPTPLKIMFKEYLYEYASDILLSQVAKERGYFKPQAVENILTEHRTGKSDYHRLIWQLLVLEEWHRKFLSL